MYINPILNRYAISIESDTILIKDGDDVIDLKYDKSTTSIRDMYITMFIKLDNDNGSMSGKYLQFTDINGLSSETVIEVEDVPTLIKNNTVELNKAYLYIMYEIIEEPEDKDSNEDVQKNKSSEYREVYIKIEK